MFIFYFIFGEIQWSIYKLINRLFPYFNKHESAWNPYILAASLTFGALTIYATFTLIWNIRKMKFMISLIKLAT